MSTQERVEQDLRVVANNEPVAEELSHWVAAIKRSQAVVEFTPDGTILSANDHFLKMAGYGLDEIQGKNHRILCDAEYVQSSEYVDFWKKLSAGTPEAGEYKRVGKNGSEFWVVASYNPILGANGKVQKIVQLATNVTETKLELKVRTDIMNLTSIVSESNLRGDIITINDKYIEVSKYGRAELIGQPHSITRHPDMQAAVFKEMWSTIGRGKMFRGIIKNRAKDGTPYYVDAVIAPILGANGKPQKYLGVRYDITKDETERQHMRGLFHAVDSSFAYVEFDTSGSILSYNKNFQAVMGYSEDEAKEKHHRIFCELSDHSSPEYAKFWADLREGHPQSGIFKRKTHSGQTVYLQAVYSPVKNETGEVNKVIKIAIDVTKQQILSEVQEASTTLASTAEELTATAIEMSNAANSTTKESQSVSAAANQVATGIQTVATNMEEMVASIKEIGRSTNESAHMAKTTLGKAQESNRIVTKLGDSSQEIGEVIKVISSIAQQTNLLALNAQIEAARAGEAGKGFAVVANEVKELAKQTAKATDDITNKINAIQADTKDAVEAIGGISKAVENLNGLSAVVATAVEEQTATTNEISRVVTESKKGVDNIVSAIKAVSQAAGLTSSSSAQTVDATRGLSKLAENLLALVKRAK